MSLNYIIQPFQNGGLLHLLAIEAGGGGGGVEKQR